jgi:hypothetical protein
MPRRSQALDSLPSAATGALVRLGADLALARKRRKQSLRSWALRLNVSVPTLAKLEKGDPAVSAGVYATALWMIQRHEALASLAEPQHDLAALEVEIQAASRRGVKR